MTTYRLGQQHPQVDPTGWLGWAFLTALCLCAAVAVYHPVYFGDELFAFSSMGADARLLTTFAEMNEYKPRLLMNLFWAWVATEGWPRWVPMLAFVLPLATSAWIVFRTAVRRLEVAVPTALVAAVLVLFSKFDAMLYFDYVSGTVETLSLLALIGSLLCIFDWRETGKAHYLVAATFLAVVTVLVHERFVAAYAAISLVLVVDGVRRGLRWHSSLLAGVALGLVPAIAFVALNTWLSRSSVTTGTSGEEVKLGIDTLFRMSTYASNVLLGSNYGPNWFVGNLNPQHPWHAAVKWVAGTLLLVAWLIPVLDPRTGLKRRHLVVAAVCVAAAIGLVAVASLPAADRQEARWMLPVVACVLLAMVATYRDRAARLLLLLMLATQAFYFAWGGLGSISSIRVSRMAGAVGETLYAVDLPGRAGTMVAAPEPETTWMLGSSGEVFCRVNLAANNCIYPAAAGKELKDDPPGFGLIYTGTSLLAPPTYRYVSQDVVAASFGEVPAGGRVLGRDADWSNWVLSRAALPGPAGLEVTAVSDNFLRMDVGEIDGGILVYRAGAASLPSRMRMQINWHDVNDSFITAQLEVVDLTATMSDYSTFVVAPERAAYGYVYATLHDDSPNPAIIAGVRLLPPR